MPGSIHLSVIEWRETTPQGPSNTNTPYFIKVSVGNNEYQSAGRGDFSFPVTTIRDNLIIMLCDSGGNIVAMKEVKIISIAEKRDAQIVFPLPHGGDLKLRLSFVLNEQEKEKIREMRSSALKRKHEELLKGTNDILSPGNSKQVTSKDYSKLSNQKMPKVSTDTNRNKIEEHGAPHLTNGKKKISFLTISQSGDQLTGANKRSAPSESNRNPSDNIKKMINAFECNAKQNLGSQISPRRTPVNKSAYQTSIESMSYENEDIKETRVSQTLIRRSFSAGNLKEAILQTDHNFTQRPHFSDTPGSVSNERSVEVNTESRKTNLLQGYVVTNQPKKDGLPNEINDERVGVNIKNMVTNLLQESAVRHQNKVGSLSNKVFDGTIISESDEKVQVKVGNRKMSMLQRSVFRNQRKGLLSDKVFDVEKFHGTGPYLDQGISRSINELSCMDRTSYYCEFSGMLMPHHLCLTSAPKKVMNFLESFTTNSVHNEKKKLHGAASDDVQLEIGSRNQTDDPQSQRAGISILNGWLIEQGARIFIVIVACGTIIFNTR